MVGKYWSTLQHLRETDLMLEALQSFATNPTFYTVPDCVRSGYPLFYLNPGNPNPVSADAR